MTESISVFGHRLDPLLPADRGVVHYPLIKTSRYGTFVQVTDCRPNGGQLNAALVINSNVAVSVWGSDTEGTLAEFHLQVKALQRILSALTKGPKRTRRK